MEAQDVSKGFTAVPDSIDYSQQQKISQQPRHSGGRGGRGGRHSHNFNKSHNNKRKGGPGRGGRGDGRRVENTIIKISTECTQCGSTDGKYKCPKCRVLYCSVACCKLHKENSCSSAPGGNDKAVTTTSSPMPTDTIPKSKYLGQDYIDPLISSRQDRWSSSRRGMTKEDEFEEGWRMTPEMEQAILKSDRLRKELADGGLRQMLMDILMDPNPQQALEQAKKTNVNFTKFINETLLATGIVEKVAVDGPTLTGENELLMLKAPPSSKKKRVAADLKFPTVQEDSSDSSSAVSSSSSSEDDGDSSSDDDSSSVASSTSEDEVEVKGN
jgi:hypothetical protein